MFRLRILNILISYYYYYNLLKCLISCRSFFFNSIKNCASTNQVPKEFKRQEYWFRRWKEFRKFCQMLYISFKLWLLFTLVQACFKQIVPRNVPLGPISNKQIKRLKKITALIQKVKIFFESFFNNFVRFKLWTIFLLVWTCFELVASRNVLLVPISNKRIERFRTIRALILKVESLPNVLPIASHFSIFDWFLYRHELVLN